jgi:hypothetical protein
MLLKISSASPTSFYVPGPISTHLYAWTHLIPFSVLWFSNIIIPILQMIILRHGKLNEFLKVTQAIQRHFQSAMVWRLYC